MKNLAEIKTEVERLAATIEASQSHALPTYAYSADFARPHIEVDSQGYHLVIIERGQELERFTTVEFDDVLYRIFKNVTSALAIDYELSHRVDAKDCRRIIFSKQLELLTKLSQHWADRQAMELDGILKKYPFDDQAAIRARLSMRVGWKKACEQYPLPLVPDTEDRKS